MPPRRRRSSRLRVNRGVSRRPFGSHSPAREGMLRSMPDERETDTDAYRPSEATRLRTIITGHREGLAICGISGAGGIGKSYLVEHVLSSLEPAKAGWLALRVDAAQAQARGDFFALVDGQLARRSLAPPADPRVDYFPETRRVAAAHRALVARGRKGTRAPRCTRGCEARRPSQYSSRRTS